MSLGKLNSRILADRVAWINRMLEEVGKLPLDDYECFILDSRNIWTAKSCMPDTTATYEKGKLYEFVRFTDQRDPAGEPPSPRRSGTNAGGTGTSPGRPSSRSPGRSRSGGCRRPHHPSAWTEDEKNTFNQTLLNLQETIQALLNPPAPSNLA